MDEWVVPPAGSSGRVRPAEHEVVVVGDVQLGVRRSGTGVPVLLHPSLGRPASDFEDLSGRLAARGFEAIAVEPRGIGLSTAAPHGATLHDLAADLVGLASVLGHAAFHVVGHAFGNRVVRCLAADHPDKVLSVSLLAAGGSVAPSASAQAALRRSFDRDLSDHQRVQAIGDAFFAPGNDPGIWLDGWHPAVAEAQRASGSATALADWWDAGGRPTLVVQGRDDVIAPPENGRLLVRTRPDVELVEIDGAGHALLPERPDEVAEAVCRFLDRQALRGVADHPPLRRFDG